MAELQTIPARHGTATFVPAGQTIKIVNTSGTQVIDTWAFALPNPDTKKGSQEQKQEQKPEQDDTEAKKDTKSAPAQKKKNGGGLPSQEEAEKATEEGMKGGEEATQGGKPQQTPKKWSSCVPSIGWSKKNGAKEPAQETEQQKNSRTWSSIIPTGKGFGNYIPQSASDTVSAFASTVCRFAIPIKSDVRLTVATAPSRSQQELYTTVDGVLKDASGSSRLEW